MTPPKKTLSYIFGSAKGGETARQRAGVSRVRPLPTADELLEKRKMELMELTEEQEKRMVEARDLALKWWRDLGEQKDVRVVGGAISVLSALFIQGFTEAEVRLEQYRKFCGLVRSIYSEMTGDPVVAEEFEFGYEPAVAEKMAENPKIADDIRETNARIQQALTGIDMRDQQAVFDALAKIGMQKVDDDEADEIMERVKAKRPKVN